MKRLFLLGTLALGGCSTMSTPVLRHETGETLGPGKSRLGAGLDSSRMYGLIPSTSPAVGQAQEVDVLRSSHLWLGGSIGLLTKTDIGLRTYFKLGGSGWRLGVKQGLFKFGNLSIAGALNYGSHVGKGSVSYLSSTSQAVAVEQVLGAKQIDFGVPLSYRFGNGLVSYGGLTYFSTNVTGVADTVAVTKSVGEIGLNLGVRIPWSGLGRPMEVDIEGAMLSASDPTGGGSMLHYGLGLGIPL